MKRIGVFIALFLITLYVSELFLKKKYKPGYQTHYKGFEFVDSLIVYQDYCTDNYGNYVLSPLLTDSLKNIYNYKDCTISDNLINNKIASTDGIKRILKEFCTLKSISNPKTEFEKFAFNILNKDKLDKVDSLYVKYITYPFNSQGFRSIEYKNVTSDKTKILIIGDSFVWGMSAKPYYNSFTDILSARNYIVYNAGIASIDPIQYLNVAKKYLNQIDPDIVIINFYEGNDIMNKDRIHKENIPHEHITNAGFFESSPEGKYLGAKEAYNYYVNNLKIPKDNALDVFLSKTAIGSIIWTAVNKDRLNNFYSNLSTEQQIELTKKYIDSLAMFLETNSTPYFFTITPDVNSSKNKNSKYIEYDSIQINKIFNDLTCYSPKNLKSEDYNEPRDIHFNNSGSIKYANFIDSILQETLNVK